jgi:osmoprotectant transport system permease protein
MENQPTLKKQHELSFGLTAIRCNWRLGNPEREGSMANKRNIYPSPLLAVLAVLSLAVCGCARRPEPNRPPIVRIGSKAFTESVILGQIIADLVAHAGAEARHEDRLGDTAKVWNALLLGSIDVYCEYTGTLTQQILVKENLKTDADLRRALGERGLRMSRSLGFQNNYALAMTKGRAAELGINTISDLRKHPELKVGLSAPFLDRPDGWRALRQFYALPQDNRDGLEHALACRSLSAGALDVTDVYTTDAAIRNYNLKVLTDDRHFFPRYDAVLVYRAALNESIPQVAAALSKLEGLIDEQAMIEMNARVDVDRATPARVAADFLAETMHIRIEVEDDSLWQRVLLRTRQHALLVLASLSLAIVTAVPLGVAAARRPRLGFLLLAAIGIVQTIPALALLVLLLVLLRGAIGATPAIIALFLYSLLPIVRNTHTGLLAIPLPLRESAEALGLSPWPRLYLIELPLASPAILAGIKTAAVINVGYATLGGLIGAGGYGQPIMDGVTRSDPQLILEGAVPAVVMALLVQMLFEAIERIVVPKGMRLRPVE